MAIPANINGLPVASIGDYAFYVNDNLTSVTISNGVTSIGDSAFAYCSSLASVYFQGNAPTADSSVFANDINATVFYLLGTTGWEATFAGAPVILSYPSTTFTAVHTFPNVAFALQPPIYFVAVATMARIAAFNGRGSRGQALTTCDSSRPSLP